MSRFHNWNAQLDAASPRIAAIRAAARGEAAPRSAAAVAAKPLAASPLAGSPAPAKPLATAPAKTSYVAQPLTPRLRAIRDEVLAEMAQDAKERRQAAIRASWDRVRAEAAGEAPDDRPDPHGWAAIHQKIRAERASLRKGI